MMHTDKERAPTTGPVQDDQQAVKILGECQHIPAQSKQEVIFVLTKFTIPDNRRLVAEVFEKSGGRNLNIKIKNKTVVKAQPVLLTP